MKIQSLAVLWEWGPGTGHEGARFWGCHFPGDEKDCRYSEWWKWGFRPLGASKVTVTEGKGLDLIPPRDPQEGQEGRG